MNTCSSTLGGRGALAELGMDDAPHADDGGSVSKAREILQPHDNQAGRRHRLCTSRCPTSRMMNDVMGPQHAGDGGSVKDALWESLQFSRCLPAFLMHACHGPGPP